MSITVQPVTSQQALPWQEQLLRDRARRQRNDHQYSRDFLLVLFLLAVTLAAATLLARWQLAAQ